MGGEEVGGDGRGWEGDEGGEGIRMQGVEIVSEMKRRGRTEVEKTTEGGKLGQRKR